MTLFFLWPSQQCYSWFFIQIFLWLFDSFNHSVSMSRISDLILLLVVVRMSFKEHNETSFFNIYLFGMKILWENIWIRLSLSVRKEQTALSLLILEDGEDWSAWGWGACFSFPILADEFLVTFKREWNWYVLVGGRGG